MKKPKSSSFDKGEYIQLKLGSKKERSKVTRKFRSRNFHWKQSKQEFKWENTLNEAKKDNTSKALSW